jgi:hypothetical protein
MWEKDPQRFADERIATQRCLNRELPSAAKKLRSDTRSPDPKAIADCSPVYKLILKHLSTDVFLLFLEIM